MLLSASELKRQLMEEAKPDKLYTYPADWDNKKKDYAEVGQHIKRMTGTNGWKILETWMIRQLDLNVLLRGTDQDRNRAAAIADVLRQVNHWIAVGEKANEELEPKKTEE